MLNRHKIDLSYFYAWFLVFITPLAIPFAFWTAWQGWVTKMDLLTTLGMYCVSGLGITLGYHRLITHRAFQTKPWLKFLLLVCGSFAMQGSPAAWAAIHMQHHRFADKPGDPHSVYQQGFWYAHCGWIFRHYKPHFRLYGKWVLKDNVVKHVSRYYLCYSNLGLMIPFVLGGWVGLLWAGVLRLFLTCHMTWCVNSVCHRWGKRTYTENHDESTNHLFLALLTFGEGWHNNHHRYLQMPFLGHRWYEIDLGKWFLIAFKQLGWIWELKIPRHLKSSMKKR